MNTARKTHYRIFIGDTAYFRLGESDQALTADPLLWLMAKGMVNKAVDSFQFMAKHRDADGNVRCKGVRFEHCVHPDNV